MYTSAGSHRSIAHESLQMLQTLSGMVDKPNARANRSALCRVTSSPFGLWVYRQVRSTFKNRYVKPLVD
jgi:hypothetical protein